MIDLTTFEVVLVPKLGLRCPRSFKELYSSSNVTHSVISDPLQPHGLSSPGSSVHGLLQASILEWVAIPFSRESS